MNEFMKNLNRVEFIITYDCTGQCKHCSNGKRICNGVHLEKNVADVLHSIKKEYNINSVMTFGGEPLLYFESVCAIHNAATELGIEHRQLITNGFFSKDAAVIKAVCEKLANCGVNDVLLSVDAFHQETIPTDVVKTFAIEIKKRGVWLRTSPAWLVSREDANSYNMRTAEIIEEFNAMGIEESAGNIVFPEGNAKVYLSEFFEDGKEYVNPYTENPYDVRSISIEPDGGIFGENVFENNIGKILDGYMKM